MKCSSEMLQNLPYFWNTETRIVFFGFHFGLIYFFFQMNALVYIDIDQNIHFGKNKAAQNEKRKKLHGFSYSKNRANFEAFHWNISSSINLLFLKSEY